MLSGDESSWGASEAALTISVGATVDWVRNYPVGGGMIWPPPGLLTMVVLEDEHNRLLDASVGCFSIRHRPSRSLPEQ